MKLFSKSLLASAAVLTLTPLSALAVPTECDVKCTRTTSCTILCTNPGTVEVITCGEWGICASGLMASPDEPQASAAPVQAPAADAELVCREPALTAAPSAES